MARLRLNLRLFALAAAVLLGGALACAQIPLADPSIAGLGGAAKLLSFTGQISVMRDSTAWALNAGDIVKPEQVVVTGDDGYGIFQVADGSKFEVFPKSRVVFRANRGDWKDLLEVWLGKVRVQIEHAGGVPNRNKVWTPTAVISVRGTVFDVEVEDDNGTTLVLDEEGQVEVRHLLKVGEPKVLNPADWIRIYKNEPIAQKTVDKGSLLQRAARAASDAFYQAALNASRGTSVAHGAATGAPADKNNGNPAPPPPPPPPRRRDRSGATAPATRSPALPPFAGACIYGVSGERLGTDAPANRHIPFFSISFFSGRVRSEWRSGSANPRYLQRNVPARGSYRAYAPPA